MLTGTLVTVAGFLPIGFNGSAAGEYTYSLFVVIAASLLVSWVVAVLFAPLIGVKILPKAMKGHHEKPSRAPALNGFRALLLPAMRFRWVTVASCVGLLGAAIVGMGHVQQQFLPGLRPARGAVDMTLPQNASIAERRRRRWTGSSRR